MDREAKKELLSTEKLMKLLEESSELDKVLSENAVSITDPDLPAYLAKLIQEHDAAVQDVFEKAVLSRSFGYQILNGQRNPNRNILIRIAIVMQLSVDETQHLLKISQRGELYPKIRRDAAIIFCIKNKCSIYETDELLEDIGEATLL